ncbi:hypothetical protein ACHMW5_13825 [Azospirillum melinis]|uniref:hypothetical protein n=1 Tax=Azospirillum melinis TaxID=328839 RepID=UPI003756E0F9
MADQLVEVTDRLVEQAKTPAGSWTRAQLAIVGVTWPPKQGWRKRIEGKKITKADAERFVSLGKAGKKPSSAKTVTGMALKSAALDYVTAAYARAYEMARNGDDAAGCIADDLEKAIAILRAAGK